MRWTIKKKPSKEEIQAIENQIQVNSIVASLLYQRNIKNFEEARLFFKPLLSDLHDPFLMKDMQKATQRIEKAIENNENILIFGDYDVDGTTAVSLVSSYLKSYYPNIDTYIPDRYNEGYGISNKGIDYAHDNDITLIIALDCGIKSIEHIDYATEIGIDFIICDHHKPGEFVPKAIAILNPKQTDCFYPYKELCGCGVGFKLIQALATNNHQTIEDLVSYLDLVAIAIGADIVPITGENRILAKFGLEVINSSPRPGIKALTQQIKKEIITITDVVFIIAPRINAAGRIEHGNYAVQLLSEFNLEQAQEFAARIEEFNSERKEIDKQITLEALNQIEENKEQNKCSTVVYNPNWHKGVIGIVASRLTETYYRPTIVFTKSNNKLAASARSVKDFDIYEALQASSMFLEQFGGHKYAAGMTLLEKNYEKFKAKFEEVVKNSLAEKLKQPEIEIDLEINLEQIDHKLIRILKQFEPFGPENMTPIFISKNTNDTGYGKLIGKNNEHLKLFVKQNDSQGFGAIGFNLAEKFIPNKAMQIIYSLEENIWNNENTIQLKLRDLKIDFI